MSKHSPEVLPDRYGSPPGWSRPVLIVAIVAIAVAAMGWLYWAVAHRPAPSVSAQLRGFVVTSDHSISLTLTVARDNGDAVRCDVAAEAADHTVVGERSVVIPAGGPGTLTVTEPLVTERLAVNGLLRTCVVVTRG